MSPIGKALLRLCDNDLTIDLNKVEGYFPYGHRGQLVLVALHLGLRIKGGS